MSHEVAIVGAGAAGASAAFALRDAATVTVFEKSRGVCGRAATRRRGDCTYDYGANYVKSDDDRVSELVTETLETDGLVDVTDPVWTFDADGTISAGEDRDDHRWTWERGLTQFAKRLFARTDATVRLETRVERLARTDGGWRVHGTDGAALGTFDRVLLTPPAPQTADLLAASEWADERRAALAAAARRVPYRTVYSAVFHHGVDLDRPWYALVNVDDEHPVGWLSREECKRGHVPESESLLVVQMAPDWSAARLEDDPDAVCVDAAGHVATLLDDGRLADPNWTDHQGWRYALADAAVDPAPVAAAAEAGLHVAGDWVAGAARVHAAARSGLDAGERIAAALD